MAERVWSDLDKRERRRAVFTAALAIVGAWVVLFTAYYLMPFRSDTHREVAVRLVIAIVVFFTIFLWQLKHILEDDLPGLRAARAMGVLLPLFLVSFSVVYLSLASATGGDFNQPLNHTSALYFTVTVFSSVGFGDITPRGDTAQLIVSVQMILDLIVIATVARVLLFAAKTGRSRAGASTDGAFPARPRSSEPEGGEG